jgi:hypothetical protein
VMAVSVSRTGASPAMRSSLSVSRGLAGYQGCHLSSLPNLPAAAGAVGAAEQADR